MAKNRKTNSKNNSKKSDEDEIEPWDWKEQYYGQWQEEQVASGKWKIEKMELGA